MRRIVIALIGLLGACHSTTGSPGGAEAGVAPEFADIDPGSFASAQIERQQIGGGGVAATSEQGVYAQRDADAPPVREAKTCPLTAEQTTSLIGTLRHASVMAEQPSGGFGADMTIKFSKSDGRTLTAVIGDANPKYAPNTPIFFNMKGATLTAEQRAAVVQVAAAAGCPL
jgi:hypothetical protein